MTGHRISRRLRRLVIERDGLICQLCGTEVRIPDWTTGSWHEWDWLHIDHIVERAAGGPDTLENLRATCARCNLNRPKEHLKPAARARAAAGD